MKELYKDPCYLSYLYHTNSKGCLAMQGLKNISIIAAEKKAEIIPIERNIISTCFFHIPDPDNAGVGRRIILYAVIFMVTAL